MADFSIAFAFMIHNEDYNTNDPRYGQTKIDNDGGKVRFGLNSKSFPDLLNTDFYTSSVEEAFKNAQNLYNSNIWQGMRGAFINSQRVASKMLDMSTNMGVGQAIKLAQRAAGTVPDGKFGPITLGAINTMDENKMLIGLVEEWNWFIGQILINNPANQGYEKAWRARANKLPPAA